MMLFIKIAIFLCLSNYIYSINKINDLNCLLGIYKKKLTKKININEYKYLLKYKNNNKCNFKTNKNIYNYKYMMIILNKIDYSKLDPKIKSKYINLREMVQILFALSSTNVPGNVAMSKY